MSSLLHVFVQEHFYEACCLMRHADKSEALQEIKTASSLRLCAYGLLEDCSRLCSGLMERESLAKKVLQNFVDLAGALNKSDQAHKTLMAVHDSCVAPTLKTLLSEFIKTADVRGCSSMGAGR